MLLPVIFLLADVIANMVEDVKTTKADVNAYCKLLLTDVIAMHLWQMLSPPNAV